MIFTYGHRSPRQQRESATQHDLGVSVRTYPSSVIVLEEIRGVAGGAGIALMIRCEDVS